MSEITLEEIKTFHKENSNPEGIPVLPISENPWMQLFKGLKFAETQKHSRFAFLAKDGGYCVRGFLVAGNGVYLKPGQNFGYPFTGKGEDIQGNEVDLSIFRQADDALAKVLGGNGDDVMDINDSAKWFNKDYVLAMFTLAMEDFPLTPADV